MKILQLRFKNLNSLVGEWQIDFSHPVFAEEGIFAITGQTGSGKTTILDAISLALYGRTPRLDRITANSNEIMSRHTGECFAEVVFSTPQGVFCCHWSQHRARKNPQGELQAPKHEISEVETGKLIANKLRDVLVEVEQITGMDFDRFTRSILLAQGAFAAFLQASADERAPILEQITGTEVYSQISILVHERNRQEQDALKELSNQIAHIQLLTGEQESELKTQQQEQRKQQALLQTQLEAQQKSLAWLQGMSDLQQKIHTLKTEKQISDQQLADFKPNKQRLALALKVAEHDGSYRQLETSRKQFAHWQRQVAVITEQIPALKAAYSAQQDHFKQSEQQEQAAQQRFDAMQPVHRQVAEWDGQIHHLQNQLQDLESKRLETERSIQAKQLQQAQGEQETAEVQQSYQQYQLYLAENKADELLAQQLPLLQQTAEQLKPLHNKIAKDQADLADVEQQFIGLSDKKAQLQGDVEQAKIRLAQALEQMQAAEQQQEHLLAGRLLRELHQEKDALLREQSLIQRVISLEHERAKLHDGKPCPLCGSEHHPYAQGQIPELDAVDARVLELNTVLEQIEHLHEAIKQHQAQRELAASQLNKAEQAVLHFAADERALNQRMSGLKTQISEQETVFEQNKQQLLEQAKPFFRQQMNLASVGEALQQLGQRAQAWQQAQQQVIEWQSKAQQLSVELGKLQESEAVFKQLLVKQESEIKDLKERMQALKEQRQAVFADKSLSDEQQRLEQEKSQYQEQLKQAQQQYYQQEKALNQAETQLQSASIEQEKAQQWQQEQEAQFTLVLQQLAMSSEADFIAARLSLEQREQLSLQQQQLQQRSLKLATQLDDRQTQLREQQALQLTAENKDSIAEQLEQSKQQLQTINQSLAAVDYQLQEHQRNVQQVQTQQLAIEKQQLESQKWQRLHQLIGSADGKKYRNFAQGLTFDLLIAYANQQLEKMSDRYLLLADKHHGLELNVMDNYQAGEVRSTKNLSGGESFIISLALALGLSQMASQTIRVDSLFLDEGFGTLDEDALDTALDTLANLQQSGKLIGVISHVPALKERISTQIKVQAKANGKSQLQGPGCQSLS